MSRLLCAVIAIFWLSCVAGAADAAAQPATLPPLRLEQVASGIHVLRAPGFEVDAANAGFVSNIGVIEDGPGLVLIGSGTSARFARHLQDFVQRTLGKPVVLVVNLHGGGDHVLGNGVFEAQGIPVVAHRETDRFIRASCQGCVDRLTSALGAAMMSDTEPAAATLLMDGTGRLPIVSRRLRLIHPGHTFQPGACALYDEATGVLFAGELAAHGYLPDLYNGREVQWRDALVELRALHPGVVVPSRGAPADASMLAETHRYLAELVRQTDALFEQGASLQEVTQTLDIPGFEDWYGYAQWHRRNVHFAYLHREQREFSPAAAPDTRGSARLP
ncbi:MBL fold metallo-hydrolase [Methyloversatilis thermotolerans]|uniref:MBL fold metallo-hydrolase n=1 Tax=Methyloversatilis thermotolerans TaxID=1346290 RepID=UPI0003624B3E|nr:MBL fold metallo-hydrolase [Methyloversatilis thermotolerans]